MSDLSFGTRFSRTAVATVSSASRPMTRFGALLDPSAVTGFIIDFCNVHDFPSTDPTPA